ncbi:MAG: LPD1 domain-containing protein [Alloprevotella sp.]|nr:LPD1 domain-containing protein [Alloprevotella sp.]
MPGPDKKFVFDLHKLRGVYDTMRNGGYTQSWEEFKDGVVKNGSYERRKRLFDTLKSNNDTSAKSYEEFVEGLRFVAPAKPKVAAAPKVDLPKPTSGGGKPADGSEFFGKVMRGENVSGSEPIVPKRQNYGGFDKMMTADGRPLTGDATDTWERKLVRDHGKEAGLDDEQIRRIEDGMKVKNIVADMEQTKRDADKIGRSEASSADLAADASYHDETSREADRRRRESGNYNTQVEFDRLKNNNPLIKTWKLSDHLRSVRNNDEEWLATGEKWYDENEGVFKSRVISNYGNEYVRSESVDEVIGRLKKESEELGRKVDERQLELYGGDNTKRTIADATATLTGQKLIFGMDPQLYHDDYGRSLAAAKRKIDERIETLEGHRDDPGFWAGVGERLSSRDWWTLGASDVADLSQDLVLKQKIENGEELSDADVAYLRSSMYADRDGQFYGKRGFLNRAGKLTADAIPFVAEFVFTGGGMNALQGATKLGMKAATQVGKNALKRAAAREAKELAADVTKDMTKGAAKKALGTRAKMWLLKNTGVVADDLARAGVMANTVGAGRTAGDAIGRYVGSVGVDDEGKFVYEGGVSAGEALLKAEVGNTLEYYTEMLGNHLKIGDWVAKGTEKIGAGKLSKAIKWAGSNKWLEKGGIQDLPSEGLEEEANIVLNSMLVGDNKLSDLWDGETQADIWGGMALSVGFMRSVAAAHEGYVWSRYKMQERKVERADVVAGYRFGDMADWSALKERIDGTTNEDMKGVVMSIMNDDGLHAEQKKAALDYVGSLMQLRGYNLGSVNDANDKEAAAKEAKENGDAGFVGAGEAETEKVEGDMEGGEAPAGPDAPTSNSETAALPSIDDGEQGGPVGAAFNRGREADAQERQDIAIELTDPSNVEAQEAWNGVVQRINEDADLMVAQQRAQTKEMQHKDGNVRPAILKEKDSEGNDQQVYIVDGNVEMMPDGSMVDKAASDNIVVVYNPATGERKQIDPTADDGISSLGEVTTAEQREADIERSRQAYVQAQIDEAQGTVRVVPGQQLVLPNGEEGVVVAIDADGEDITVALGDGRQATVQRSELQRIRDEKALADYRQRHGITEEPAAQQPEGYEPAQPQAEGRVAGAPADYTSDMELTIRDEDGSEKPAMVMGRVRYENGSFVPDENGKIIEYYMDGEVKHAHEDVLSRDVVGYVAPHQTEAAPVEEASAETPATVETTPPPIEQQAEAVSQPMQTEEPMPAQPAIHNADDSNLDITSRERVKDTDPMPVREDGEEDWQATTPERAHAYIFNEAGLSRSEGNEFIAAQIQAAQIALMKASSANMPKVGTSIRKYNEAKAKRQEKIDEAQRVLDYWNSVREIQNAIAREENERRAAEDAARHEEAVAQVQAEYEARKRAEAERKAVGNENPMPAITEKWDNATKVDGHSDEIMLPDGTALKGHYVLHESGASSPSHNPETWQKTEGFPMDVNGGSVNDRDYERDLDAQEHTQRIAREYDQRALQNVPVVSHDGVVLSGNGRTMAGELAARDNTDGAYVNYLKEYAPKFGFTAEQVGAMQHPRVSFVPDEAMPYTAETFAKFNQQEMKSQNKTEMAVKLGKTVSDDSFKGIVRTINGYDTLGDFYNDAHASLGAVYDLHNAGVVPQAQLAEMVDGVRGQEKLSAVGREFLENMLIGKAFEGAPDVVRMLTAEPLMRQTVITALGEIVDNIALGGGWSLQGELADAVKLCFDARQGGAKYGEIVSTYARQGVLFADPDELQTVADFNNATMLMLADVLNDKRVTLLKTTLQLYNNNARESASGQADMFAGGVRSREDILRDVINFINENYGKRKEIEAARAAAVERRKAEGVVAEDKPGGTRSITSKLGSTLVGTGIQQNGTPPAVGGESEDTGGSGGNKTTVSAGLRITDPRTMSDEERQRRGEMLRNATAIPVAANHIVSTKDKTARKAAEEWWDDNVSDAKWYETEAGEVEINRNSVESSLAHGYWQMKLDAITSLVDGFSNAVYLGTMPDLTRQDGVLNHYFAYPINYNGKRSYVFCRALHDNNTNRLYVHEVFVEDKIKKGNTLQTAASQPHGGISLYRDILANVLLSDGKDKRVPYKNKPSILERWSVDGSTTISPAEVQQPADTENISALDQSISNGKGSDNPSTNQAKGEKVAGNQSPSGVEAAEGEVNTEPTVAQKEAAASVSTTEEGSRLAELRTKYPDRVFGERHEDGSVTYYDEDALLVCRLLGREFDGEDLTLPKKEADKAFQKLLANGHKAAYYGKNWVLTAYDETSADSESPVATNKSLAGSGTSVSAGKGTDLFGNAQGSGKQSSSDGKIDDVGEVLAGARKDMRGEIAKSLANVTEAALVEKPFGKVYKKPDLKKAVESGALREKDAIFYEALFSMVNQQKPKVTQSEMRSKLYIPDYKTKAERWAADTFKQMEVLRQFMELDEPGRDAMMERMLADRYPTREQELAEIEKRKGWNPDYEGHKYAWGEMTTPNPLWVTHEVMNRLGYSVGDKLDVPYGVVKANTSGTGYSIENLKGERASLFGSGMTLDEAIDRIVYLAKLKRGDADVSHPTGLFSFPATKSESGESGRYRVMWGRDYKTREFESKDDADAFAQTKSGAYVSPIMETKRRFGYKVRFIHPLTGEKLFVDDAEFDTKEEAQAYFDGNFEKLNEATNAKLQDEREMKGEKKMLTADDVVHVTMIHSGNGWTHAVVIDKKYANNDGQVRIIKEGFASRKDAKAFADRVKGDVLKTVLKHKEDAKKIVYFDTGENSRIGEDYRNGKNVDAEDFMNTFGFRGVQFGNWTNQADRQMAVNQAYDAFMDMARLIGVSPKAMSLNGELGIAFGARGVGGSAAHYERGEVVINLTKTQGAGSLAHEWWHALDNYFARRAGSADDMVTDNRGIEMRDALRKAFNDMLDMVKGSDYAQRSTGKGEYWGRTHEITARLLAEWVDRELKKRGELNTFLSRGAVVERGQQDNYNVYEVLERLAGREPMSFEDYRELPESLKGIPYPSAKEVEQFSASLRHIFDTLEEKVDEETGNVMLYEPTATYETRDGKKVVWRSLFDDMDVRSSDEVAKVSQDTQQGQGQNQVIAPSEIRLRKLKKGETCHVERRYVENGMFDFTGKEKVESAEDVAYIFRQLENAAVENSFLVLVKDGRPTVIHLGVGSYANVMAPYEQALVAYRELKPEQVYFVHNHPSGVLKASRQDQEMLKRIKMAFGEDVVQQGIIIDTTSGKYGEFDMVVDNYDLVQTSGVEGMPQSDGADVPVKVYQFSRQVFAPDWNPESAFKIVSSESVAEFVSSHRLGKHKKMSFLVVNNSGDVVANVFLPWTKLSDIKRSKDAGELLAGYVHQCGGVSGVLYGNYEYEPDDQVVLSSVSVRMRQLNAQLLDAVHVEHSAYENGWAGVGEPKDGYGVGATDVRSIAQRMDEERGTEVARFVDFLRRGKLGEGESRYFHVGDTGGLLNEYGISGKITVSSSAANSHHNKDKDHLSDTDWVDVFDKINEPIAITRYGDRPNSFRIYTIVEKNGKNICVGVDVNSVGRNVNITNIKTGFARDIANALNEELVYPGSRQELETAIQERSLRHNREVYPEQPYDAAKVVEEFEVPKVWDEKNSDGADEAYLANVNSRFNDELGRLTEENKDKVVLSLGRPSAVLLSAGVEDKSMKLYGNKVIKKMKKHGFALDELRDLPRAVADPIAVFDNYQLEGNRTVLTELQSKGKNIMVAVTLGKDGVDVDFNIVSSVFGKGEDNIVDWLNKGYARYINKEKALNYLHHSDRHISEALSNPKLVSATKVVEDFVNPVVVGEKNEVEDSARYRTSEDLTEEYGDSWLTEQTNDDGRHTTQVKNTINSYKKFGEWVKKDSRGREVSVLDASSGLGLGTHWMRENGMTVDDVEPYPSADREEPTFGSYDEIDKQYDYIISNAVLNVIPDDWRASLLHDMASKLKPGGKLVINVRGAESIRRQGNEGMTRITLDDPSEILVLRPDGSIKAYQKGFTKDELQDWCEEELGDGYTVLKASRDNAGGTYDTAVVVIKNNGSTTKGSASELGQPTENGAALANFGAMIGNNSERAKRLSDLSLEISRAGAFGSHQLLHGLNVALDLDVTPKEGGRMSTDHSRYYDLGNGVSLRIADHQGDANTFARFGHPGNNYGIVIKLSRSRFKDKDGVDYLEYVYYGDRIVGAGRQKEIVDGLRTFVESGDLSKLPRADKVNSSGRFKDAALPQQTERSSSAKRLVVEELAEKLHTDINIIEDVNEITHPNAAVQERRRKSKGWYDTATGQVNIVLDNNRDVDDVKASVGHETIAHKGLRELVGEENYDEFLDEVYGHLRDDLKQGVDAAAGRAFVDDATKNGKRAKSYEQHRRTAVDELFGRLAEKPFEEFTEGERTLWQKLKAAVRKLLDKFLGSLKLPKWFELGDNELRYILWRSKERLERGREHPIDLARDIVKREELGLKDEARYNMGDAPETFKSRQKRAVENKGTVMPGLNGAQVKVVDVPRHHYTGNIAEATRQAIEAAKTKFAPNGKARTLRYDNFGATFDYSISGSAVEESLNPKQQAKSVNKGVHIAMAEHLDEIIGQSIEVEEHPDYLKNEKGERDTSIINDKALMHRFYGAVVVDGVPYRVMTLMREEKNPIVGNGIHAYEVQKIEVLDETPNTPNGVGSHPQSEIGSSYPLAKLLQNVGKSYEKDKNLLDDSKLADESTDLYREGDDVSPDGATSPSPQQNSRTRGSAFGSDDIWTDGSMGLQERMTAAATRLANNHREDKTLRNDAMRAIGGNLADLRKAMSLQRTFDRTTVKRVADLARVLITNGYINNSTSGEIKRLLSVVKNSVGHNDIEGDVQKVMDIMVDNQLKHAEETLHELEAIKGSKVDARGVEVQGQLDAEGQTLIKAMKEAQKIVNPCGGKTHDENGEPTAWGNALESAIMRMSSNDQAVADAAAIEYAGMQMAQQWFDTIQQSKLEEQELRQELKSGYVDDSGNPIDDPQGKREWRASIEEAIRQNKIERVQAYYELVGRLTDSLRESLTNAKDFKEAEQQRIREIQHNANSDMEGRPSDEHQMPANTRKKFNNWMGNSLFAPLATYMEMLRLFGRKSANGEGYLFNRFGRGWIDARQQEIRGVRDKYAILDAKAAELFGGKVKTWGDLIRRVGKLPKGTVSFWNGGEMQEREMTQGNLMYIYMVNKMLDGRMKLRKMGISEEDVAEIERVLDPRLIELADWMQDEFLVQTRNEYNETHKRMFGASMAAIEHYFPLRVLKNAIDVKAEDLDKPEVTDGISTITGGIIKRRRNSKPLDILNADALHVILSHVAEMEHWNAYAEFNRDLNTLRSYRHFRNQVQNMNTIYGNGKNLWEKFNDVCQMATGAYKPKGDGIEKAILSAAQGVTAAKVAFRIFTALKQFASLPAYFPYVRADYLVKSMARPDVSWSWCMEHLPIFEERWKSRVSGDPRLAKSILTAADWRQNLAVKVARAGMAPNAFVDALTVSMGAYAVYQTRKGQYLRDGYSEEQAERRAIQDTEMVYNETQQSGESAFTSTMQTDRTWWKVMFSVFRNSSMAYQRQLHGALRDLGNIMKEGGVSERLAFMKKQMIRDGLSEEQADAASKRRLRRQLVKDGLAVATFGYIMQLAWNMTGYLPYLLFGDDDETKDEFWDDIWAHTMGGWLEGLTGGDVMSLGIGMWRNGEVSEWKLKKEMPLTTDLFKTGRELFKGEYSAFVTDAVNLCVQMGLGVNPQSITDGVLAIMDACGDDPALAHEATICISRILQVPQSQIDKMYFDEVGLSGDEVSKYTPAQLAERYAEFKVKRGRFFSPWSWDDEDQIGKFTEKANKTINERTEQMGDKKVNEAYLRYEEVYKGVDAKVNEAKKKAKTDYVEAAQLMAEARSDSKAFETYQMFKPMDGYFNEIVKLYLGAKTPDEAALCRQAVLDYKSAMVKVLEAQDVSTRDEAIDSLRAVMQGFAKAQSRLRSAE